MLDSPVEYGQRHGIKFKHSKTQFVSSEKCQINNPHLLMHGITITPKPELLHLGFTWKSSYGKLTLKQHYDDRISELWSVTSSLIAAGVRNLNPNIIVHLFKTLVLPKLLYGLDTFLSLLIYFSSFMSLFE